MLRRCIWTTILCTLIVLSGCVSSEEKELGEYVDGLKSGLGEDFKVDEYVEEYVNLIFDSEPDKALEILNDKVIPEHKEIVNKFKNTDFKNENIIDLNEQLIVILQLDLDKQSTIKDIFEEVMKSAYEGNIEEIDLNDGVESLHKINEEIHTAVNAFEDKARKLSEKYNSITIDEEAFQNIDVSELNEGNNQLIMQFVEVVAGKDLNVPVEDVAEHEEDSSDSIQIDNFLNDQSNPQVVFDAEVKIDGTFSLVGKSNLIEGSTVILQSYHYGSENPYLKEEIQVDEKGDFELTLDINEEDLNGDPLTLQLSYQPDKENTESQELYGSEGEKIEGPFKHKFTSIKRTRHGAFTYAYIEFKNGEKAKFGINNWEVPDDYGDLEVWMEKEKIETKDHYYDITMKSNLNELTGIKAEIEVPGYEAAGYTSRTTVMPDGTFRFQIPRPDVDSEDVIVIIEATSDMAIETEELYGEHGENFKGDLVEKTKRGQKIVYELSLGDNK